MSDKPKEMVQVGDSFVQVGGERMVHISPRKAMSVEGMTEALEQVFAPRCKHGLIGFYFNGDVFCRDCSAALPSYAALEAEIARLRSEAAALWDQEREARGLNSSGCPCPKCTEPNPYR